MLYLLIPSLDPLESDQLEYFSLSSINQISFKRTQMMTINNKSFCEKNYSKNPLVGDTPSEKCFITSKEKEESI